MKNQYVVLSLKRLMELAVQIPNPRRLEYGNNRHKLLDVLAIALMATLGGYSAWHDMYLYAQSKEAMLTRVLGLEHGIPSESTIRRVINAIKAEKLESIYRQ